MEAESGLALLEGQARTFFGVGRFDAEAELRRCQAASILLLRKGADAYPDLLASIPDAPRFLYVRGRLPPQPAVAIVGARAATAYGRRAARSLARAAAEAGLAVVSGLARGIDTAAHEGALEAGGATWAVLGSGLDHVYPPENRALADKIVAMGGAVLSEAPLQAGPHASHFPRRNRIVSGLAWLTVVVEGTLKSGALITARLAAQQGRDVGAVPGPIDSPLSAAPNLLLKEGAWPVCEISDILQCFPPAVQKSLSGLSSECQNDSKRGGGLDETQKSHYKESLGGARQIILELLGSGELPFEELVRQAGVDVPALLRLLAELEIDGLVESLPGQLYARR